MKIILKKTRNQPAVYNFLNCNKVCSDHYTGPATIIHLLYTNYNLNFDLISHN